MTTIQNAINTGTAFSIPWDPLGKELTILFVMYGITAVLNYLQSFLMASVAEKLILTLRKEISAKLHRLPLEFYDNHKPGEILSRVTSDLDKVSETLQTGLLKLIVAAGTLIGSISFMLYYSPLLTAIFLAFIVVSFIITNIVASKNLECAAKRQEALSQLTGITEEYYTGRDVIRAYCQEKESISTMDKEIDNLRITSRNADFLTYFVNPLIRFLSRISQALIILVACEWMLEGKMTLGVVQAYYQYINMAGEPLTELSFMINSLEASLASAERTFAFLDEKEESVDKEHLSLQGRPEGKICFNHVSFGYNKNELLMKDVSFTALPGQKIAIVGATGAGKTTLINLLMRFYEVNSGEITIDGISTARMTRQEIRRHFGMVLQDTWLFGGTVAENIAYGRQDATMSEIIQAAKAAQVDSFVRLMPKGYYTQLDNETDNLSVGQRQLITIARVFLCDPPVLILDEATSSVDTRTEAEIGKAMEKLMQNRTSFVIAHRLSTIRNADNILFMDHGNIIEQGTHKELLKAKGAYAELYNSQFA
jgi:ATP-binding cassette subfamily B protein